MPAELVDGFSILPFGMNCADDSEDLTDGFLSKLINGTVRGGRVKTRPPFVSKDLVFEDEYAETLFKTGRFQGCHSYELIRKIVCMIGGGCFFVDLDTNQVSCLVKDVGLMSSTVDRCYFLDAGRFFIIQDGINLPIIIDFGSARRSDPNRAYPFPADESVPELGEVPIGTHMATGHGRIAVARPNSPDFVVGNIALPSFPESILFFTETDYLNGGGAFRIPENFGNITAMGVQSAPNTSEGEGPLIVSGSRGMSWYDISLPRQSSATAPGWQGSDISRSITIYTGASSGSAFVNVNNDIVFYSKREIRTLSQATADEQSIIHKPISREVSCWLDHNDPKLDHLVHAVVHDNRFYCTVAPEVAEIPNSGGEVDVQFKGLVVLDFERTNGLEQNNRPAYDGLWTGLNFTGVCSFLEGKRAFAFSKNLGGENEVSEIAPLNSSFDNNSKAQVMRVCPKRYKFRSTSGQETALAAKKFMATSVWPTDVYGKTFIKSFVKADDRIEWAEAGTATLNAKAVVKAYSDEVLVNLPQQARGRITLGGPSSSECDHETGHIKAHGYAFDTCIEVEGVAKIRASLSHANLEMDRVPDLSVCEAEEEKVVQALVVDDYEYKIEKARSL